MSHSPQAHDRRRVEVHRISPHVSAIELPLPLEGLTSVNCYVIKGAAGAVLVDPGWSQPDTNAALLEGLEFLEIAPTDITRTLATHHHWDHYTQAITWRREHRIPVFLGRGESPSIEAWRSLDGAFPRQVALLQQAGAFDMAREVAALPTDLHEQAMDFEMPDGWIDDGDEVDLGDITVRSLATPGHTRGHVCFEVVEEQLLLTGDHVLPRITPSIAYEREPDRHSLISYLGSLRLVADLPEHRMLPAHGSMEGSAAARAAELVKHHDERLTLITDLIRAGRSTAYEVASAMTWTRRGRALTDLETTHRMVAVLEAAAHLVALERQGTVALEHHDGVEHYAVA
jgi:glyoxylase-like metal-dependent hydrolase (beta-lactamase superfamily II)